MWRSAGAGDHAAFPSEPLFSVTTYGDDAEAPCQLPLVRGARFWSRRESDRFASHLVTHRHTTETHHDLQSKQHPQPHNALARQRQQQQPGAGADRGSASGPKLNAELPEGADRQGVRVPGQQGRAALDTSRCRVPAQGRRRLQPQAAVRLTSGRLHVTRGLIHSGPLRDPATIASAIAFILAQA